MNNNLIGKKIRGTNACGKPVGKLGTIIATFNDEDRYGNYTIKVKYDDGEISNTKIFWVKIIDNEK